MSILSNLRLGLRSSNSGEHALTGPDPNMHSAAGPPQFPPAAQPEVMRAAEKDEQYLTSIADSCYDVVRRLFGARAAVAYQNEARLAGRVLYYALTTGAGLQTLGEEYCDINQVVGFPALPPSRPKRALQVFLHVVLPYLVERLSVRAASRGLALANMQPSIFDAFEDDRTDANLPSPLAAPTPRAPPGAAGGQDSRQAEEIHVREPPGRTLLLDRRAASSAMDQEAMGGPPGGRLVSMVNQATLLEGLRRCQVVLLRAWRVRWERLLRWWSLTMPVALEGLQLALRMHLMLFYFEGLFYNWAKRVTGVRYVFTGRSLEQRPRYHVLGMFLLIQVSIMAGDWLQRNVLPAVAASMRARRQASSFMTAGRRGIVVEDEDGKVVGSLVGYPFTTGGSSSLAAADADVEPAPQSKCPLCLSKRQHPTATPCGHVFCWSCVAEWCNEKQECPLCRTPVTHSSLACLYHSDF